MDDGDDRTKVVAMTCLATIAVVSIAGLTVTAVFTDRSLARAEAFTLVIALCIALIGGLNVLQVRRRRRWRVEREDVNGGAG
jgi:uncharacterized membrane protein YdfJ with MMPL/SSD domain